MSTAESFEPKGPDEEILAIFEPSVWQDAIDADPVTRFSVSTVERDRRAAYHFINDVLAEDSIFSPTERMHPGTPFIPSVFSHGTVFDFQVAYLSRVSHRAYRKSPGDTYRTLEETARPPKIINTIYESERHDAVIEHRRAIDKIGQMQLSDATYTAFRWSAIFLPATYSEGKLMAVGDDGSKGLHSLLFPRHKPASIGDTTVTKSISNKGELLEEFEHIDYIDVYEYPKYWQFYLNTRGHSTLGQTALQLKQSFKNLFK